MPRTPKRAPKPLPTLPPHLNARQSITALENETKARALRRLILVIDCLRLILIQRELFSVVYFEKVATARKASEAVDQLLRALGWARALRILERATPDDPLSVKRRAADALQLRFDDFRTALDEPALAVFGETFSYTAKDGPINTVRRAVYDLKRYIESISVELNCEKAGGRPLARIELELASRVAEILAPLGAPISRSAKRPLMRCLAILFPLCGATSSPSSVVQKIQRATAGQGKTYHVKAR